MGPYLLHVADPVICLTLNVLMQAAGFKYARNIGLLRSVFLGFASGLSLLAAAELYVFLSIPAPLGERISGFTVNLVTYAALGYCYFHFINLGETARRIRLLTELRGSSSGMSLGEILRKYNAEEVVSKRLGRLLNNGQVIFKDKRYYANASFMTAIAKVINLMKFMVMGKRMV